MTRARWCSPPGAWAWWPWCWSSCSLPRWPGRSGPSSRSITSGSSDSGALLHAALFALLGLALLQLATFLDPEAPLLERRHRICSRLAVGRPSAFY
jgi:hypothetical protein